MTKVAEIEDAKAEDAKQVRENYRTWVTCSLTDS